MVFSILTLFPEMFASPFDYSIIKKAQTKNLITINLINIRSFATDKYKTVDDKPYGGGVGMIMKIDTIDKAITQAKKPYPNLATKIILLDPKGKTYNQKTAQELAQKFQHLILIAGHYEGVDARVNNLADEIISVGNFIVTGGELPVMLVVDSITRLITGVLKPEATKTESFNSDSLEAPQYTRPKTYKNWSVPAVLLSGHHRKIADWKKQVAKKLRSK